MHGGRTCLVEVWVCRGGGSGLPQFYARHSMAEYPPTVWRRRAGAHQAPAARPIARWTGVSGSVRTNSHYEWPNKRSRGVQCQFLCHGVYLPKRQPPAISAVPLVGARAANYSLRLGCDITEDHPIGSHLIAAAKLSHPVRGCAGWTTKESVGFGWLSEKNRVGLVRTRIVSPVTCRLHHAGNWRVSAHATRFAGPSAVPG